MAAGTTVRVQNPGIGGVASTGTGDIKANGGAGGAGMQLNTTTTGYSGYGGESIFGSGAKGLIVGAAGNPALSYGGGGGGAASQAAGSLTGGVGFQGIVRITEFK
jgi:hypothetical protein